MILLQPYFCPIHSLIRSNDGLSRDTTHVKTLDSFVPMTNLETLHKVTFIGIFVRMEVEQVTPPGSNPVLGVWRYTEPMHILNEHVDIDLWRMRIESRDFTRSQSNGIAIMLV
jgi:hypothetical protein